MMIPEPQISTAPLALPPAADRRCHFAARWWCPHRPIHRVEFAGGTQECLRCGEVIERAQY